LVGEGEVESGSGIIALQAQGFLIRLEGIPGISRVRVGGAEIILDGGILLSEFRGATERL